MSEFNRIFSPRATKAVKAILLLTNGAKYDPTQEEKDQTLLVLKSAVNDIAQLYGMLPGADITPEATSAPGDDTSEKRIEKNKAQIKRSAFDRQDVYANVDSIPEEQLTAYATYIMSRLCAKFEETEAKPKNYLPATT